MNFNKMKLGKKGSTDIIGVMTELTTVIIIISIMSFIVLIFITVFAPMLQEQAATAQADATSRNATNVAKLYGIFATEGVFEILAVAVFILIVVIVMIAVLKKAAKMGK